MRTKAAIVAVLLAVLAGCAKQENLQPLIAVAGQYSLMEAKRCPTPAPVPVPENGCSKGCKCAGTGNEPTGDGLSRVPCRCPDACECKKRKSVMLSGTGTCGWPPRNTNR